MSDISEMFDVEEPIRPRNGLTQRTERMNMLSFTPVEDDLDTYGITVLPPNGESRLLGHSQPKKEK